MSKPASVIIDDFNFVSVMPPPDKTDSILIIDANAVLPQPIAFQFLEAIAGRCSQVSKLGGSVEQGQLWALVTAAGGEPRVFPLDQIVAVTLSAKVLITAR